MVPKIKTFRHLSDTSNQLTPEDQGNEEAFRSERSEVPYERKVRKP